METLRCHVDALRFGKWMALQLSLFGIRKMVPSDLVALHRADARRGSAVSAVSIQFDEEVGRGYR